MFVFKSKRPQTLIDSGMSSALANQRADSAAIRYASKQIRSRAESIVHTELAFAYNRGAHEGILTAQRAGLMNHCEMIWSTAGTNRVCGRCLSLKDSGIGRTDELGVQLPPLHPRCRCTIEYREVGKPLTAPARNGNVGGRGFDIQRFGTYEDQVQSHGGSGHLKPDKIVEGHASNPRIAEPLNIIDHLDRNGKIDKRAFYDEQGKIYLEIH